MVVVIDANILISSALKPDGNIANLIFSNSSTISFVVPAFILDELKDNEIKICKENKITIADFKQNTLQLLTHILIINDEEISDSTFKKAFGLTKKK